MAPWAVRACRTRSHRTRCWPFLGLESFPGVFSRTFLGLFGVLFLVTSVQTFCLLIPSFSLHSFLQPVFFTLQ